jgi:hypothetical protein
MTLEWITDRLPTEADADRDGDVRVPRALAQNPRTGGWWFQRYRLIVPGQPWWSEKAAERAEVKPVAVPAFSFAVGQLWRCRNGDVVRVTQLDPGTDFPVCVDNGYWHRADGTSCLYHRTDDLIELVSGPEPAPGPCLKSLTDDQLLAHHVAVQAETRRRGVARWIIEAKRPGGLLA